MAAATTVMAQNSQQDYLDLHNAARAAVGVGPVTWDNTVAAWAQNYANSRRGDCALVHSPNGRPYGENLFGGGGSGWTARDAVKACTTIMRHTAAVLHFLLVHD
ncbi:hypothetical protein PR202_ga28448 [Eleusine coracana subsp. coracana]|uniref:SCP domain-containing protein n=1 Tax=Eleusine coracana subsp. coracana TaxID=191504 RepID=A0AAV5DKD7_ELECO|nr:hypothetical protein PR202_ga28448 [Eleusine coracana subsp. coracana]